PWAERLVKFRPRRGLEGKMADIAHHAHDLKLFVFRSVVLDELADGIFAGENVLGGLFVDDCDEGRALGVVLVETASADERHAHRPEIIRRYDSDIGLILFRASRPIKSAAAVSSGKWQAADRGNAFGAWHSCDLLQNLLIKLELLSFIRLGGGAYIKYEQPVGIESRRHPGQ